MAASLSSTAFRPRTSAPFFHRRPPVRLHPTSFSIHASSSSSSRNSRPSRLRPIVITLTAASALLLASFQKPTVPIAHASPPPAAAAVEETPREQILEEHLDEHPDDVGALKALMEVKIKSENFSEAVAIIDRLIILLPSDPDLRLLRAHLLCHAGDVGAAREAFDRALENDPFLVEAYHGLVMVAGKFSDAEEGAEEMRHLVGRIEAAAERCRREKRREDLRDFRLLIAQIRVMEGRFVDALGVYQDLAKEEPRDFRPYLCQGIIYSVLKKKVEAEKQFENYRKLVPKGHPYAKYFDENVLAMKVFGQMDDNKGDTASLRT